MKYIALLLSLFLIASCGSSNSVSDDPVNTTKTLTITASGLTSPVTLLETVSDITIEIPANGNYIHELIIGQGIYQLEIVNSQLQHCTLSDNLMLQCNAAVCTADYAPVCGKEPFAGVVCVTTPCDTDRYKTFSNRCFANGANAWIAIETECLGLEDVISEHIEPVYITDIDVLDITSDSFKILSMAIDGDTLSLSFEVSGGCGSHEFDMLVDDSFLESMPVQLSNVLVYNNKDACDAVIRVNKSFDLEPIAELYRRSYPDVAGEQTVELADLAPYTFNL